MKFALMVIALLAVAVLFANVSESIAAPSELREVRAEFALERALAQQQAERDKRAAWQSASMSVAQSMNAAAVMFGYLVNVLIAVAGIALASAGAWAVRWAVRPNLIRFENGLAPIVEKNVAPWYKRIFGASEITYANPNQFVAPFVKVVNERGGGMHTLADTMGMPVATLADAHKGGQRVQMAQAGMRRQQPAASKWEVLANNGMLRDALPQRKETSTALALPAEVHSRLTLADAIRGSSAKDGIIIGQDAQTNEPCLWFPRDPHIGIWGSSQQGKTTGGASTVVLAAIAMRWHVVILDPEAEGYWSIFQHHTELVETEGDMLAAHMGCIWREYVRRGKLIEAEGVNHYNRMTSPPPRVLVVMEEFSDLYGRSNQGRVLELMETLFRRGGKRGMHFLLIDQHPSRWPDAIRQNTAMRVSFKQPVKDWSLVSYNDLDTLRRGQFAHNGRVYDAFHAESELMPTLAALPRFGYQRIVDEYPNDDTPTPFEAAADVIRSGNSGSVTPERLPPGSVLPAFLRSLLGADGKVQDASSASNEWDNLAALLFSRKPQTTQADLCRVMSAADPQGREPSAFKGSLSMDLYHCYSPHGESRKIQTAKRKAIWRERNGK